MKSSKVPSLIVMAVLGFLMLSNCKKDQDPPRQGPEGYRIVKLKRYDNPLDSIVVTYNRKYNPVMMQRSEGIEIPPPTYYFRYNARDLLTDFFAVLPDAITFSVWHRFTYDNLNRAVSDTFYEYGLVGNNGPVIPSTPSPTRSDSMHIRAISSFQYDSKNRIIRELKRLPIDPYGYTIDYHYKYGPEGNRDSVLEYRYQDRYPHYADIYTYHYQYDNRGYSLESTHPVWRLLDRDYSTNFQALDPPVEYNAARLPVKISTNAYDELFFGTEIYYNAVITYERNN